MMKMKYNKTILSLVAGALLLVPVVSQAVAGNSNSANKPTLEERQAAKEEKQAAKQDKFCENLKNLQTKFEAKISQLEEIVRSRKEVRSKNYQNKVIEVQRQMKERRSEVDENFDEHVASLEKQAQTEEQKQAIAKFETAVKAAIIARRGAIDAAQDAFHAEVRKQIEARKAFLDSLASESLNEQKAAFEKAIDNCNSGSDPKTIRDALKNSLKSVKGDFSEEKKSKEQIKAQLQAQIEIRKTAIEKAQSDFKAALEKAKIELKATFYQTATDKDADLSN